MTGLKQAMAPKIMKNPQTDIKTGDLQLCTENSELLKRFHTAKSRRRQDGHLLLCQFFMPDFI